ncbi:putative sulfate transporter 3.4 [Hibiscus syriacus]|uniref:Sulfate transporter 3.4 n=1 Tax=Hibiscus syriacus TaxID=106335 RepID=A0A6A2XGG6_HIBSY|nr:putative sulfate transporter 3.4 [Hibiscus syriacus]
MSIASLVTGTMLSENVSPAGDPILYLKLVFTATFFAGLFQASLGFLRLGFVIDFLSKATLVGFMAGAAVIVSLQQLKGLLGIVHFHCQNAIDSCFEICISPQERVVLGNYCNGIQLPVVSVDNKSIKKPKLFWVSAAAPLTSVILSTLLIFCIKPKAHGISIIDHLQEGSFRFCSSGTRHCSGIVGIQDHVACNQAKNCDNGEHSRNTNIPKPQPVQRNFKAVTAMDTSGTDMVCELKKMLDKRSLELILVNPVGSVMEKLHQSRILDSFGMNSLYLTVGEAVDDISASWKTQP